MYNGRVVHFEDSNILRESVADSLDLFSDDRHQVVGGAGTLEEALEVLEQMQRGEVDANVVLLDGNLSQEVTGNDARKIFNRIQELGLSVRVIGMSNESMETYGIAVDAEIGKNSDGSPMDKLVEILDELPEPEET